MASKNPHSSFRGADGKRATASGSRNSRLQQAHSLPPQEQQPPPGEMARRADTTPAEARNENSSVKRGDIERETRGTGASSDFSGSGPETDERAHEGRVDGMVQAQLQVDGKVEVDTRQQPKYHSGKQTHR